MWIKLVNIFVNQQKTIVSSAEFTFQLFTIRKSVLLCFKSNQNKRTYGAKKKSKHLCLHYQSETSFCEKRYLREALGYMLWHGYTTTITTWLGQCKLVHDLWYAILVIIIKTFSLRFSLNKHYYYYYSTNIQFLNHSKI